MYSLQELKLTQNNYEQLRDNWLPKTCEGGGDVVGVVTPLVRGVAKVLHGDQVVELSLQLEVQEVEGKEEDRSK